MTKRAAKIDKASLAGHSPIVAKQYSEWVYPIPPQDLEEMRKIGSYDMGDPSKFRRVIWPKNVEPEKLNILVAGCGTRQAAELAYNNPDCRVLGIDISEPSLQHQQYLKEKHSLDNLDLKLMSLTNIADLGQKFDYICSTGVLHHLPDPDAGLRALRDVLEPHGVMQLMVYGYHRRYGVYMMQEAFRIMGVTQSKDDVAFAKQAVEALPSWHHVRSYMTGADDLAYDSGIVDTFLHPQDRAYTVPQVMDFAKSNGLKFRSWLNKLDYSIQAVITDHNHPLFKRAQALPVEQQWALVELLAQSLGCHRFMLCHPSVPDSDFKTNFKGDAFLSYKPKQRMPTMILSETPAFAQLKRDWQEFMVETREFQLYSLADGTRTIREILEANNWWQNKNKGQIDLARAFYARMAEWDHLMFELP